ncbi:hypothetical protein JOE57_002106 [Microlunatus panaciterrae]|uniref:NERD domain-containing protein n=1 Tax=Microlunatus panaciterrae TaxID=400768 RepID=A0ABS2RJJ9_9ACTN|nr:nuclease-related domain-containing protein [Microlunatus panaciterrae]MBM7799185.1 hypothetical protein [Microlunatus panaciterrae]
MGEFLVFGALRQMAQADLRWGFLNSIPVGSNGADIDHLVIGSGGVFTINAKYHSGARIWVGGDTLMVNGVRHPYVRNSRFEAQRAARLLSRATRLEVSATGLVVPVNVRALVVKEQPPDVNVVSRDRLCSYLLGRPPRLRPDEVLRTFAAARLSSTWGTR